MGKVRVFVVGVGMTKVGFNKYSTLKKEKVQKIFGKYLFFIDSSCFFSVFSSNVFAMFLFC